MKRNFGTVGAVATAFVSEFHPQTANNSGNLETTAAGSPNTPRSYERCLI